MSYAFAYAAFATVSLCKGKVCPYPVDVPVAVARFSDHSLWTGLNLETDLSGGRIIFSYIAFNICVEAVLMIK